jgi:exonuclease-1
MGMALAQKEETSRASEYFQRAVDVTPTMARRVIDAIRGMGVQCIVAPYEADAQLAFLATQDFVDVVITEDSDLLAYGCPRVCLVVW